MKWNKRWGYSVKRKKNYEKNIILILLVVIIGIFPLLTIRNSEFSGVDGKAEEIIQEINPNYEPWLENIVKLPGGETESLLFALQAALGAGVIGYVLGYLKGERKNANR